MISGGDSIEEIENLKEEVTSLLKCGQFESTKWRSNESNDNIETEFKDEDSKSVLGLFWNTKKDNFFFKYVADKSSETTIWTKLSQIGKIYDPLGFLGPVTITGKLFI